MKDGRSRVPALPEFLREEAEVRAINRLLGSNYTLEQMQDMPELWIEKMLIWASME
jgi:hypothetical protein